VTGSDISRLSLVLGLGVPEILRAIEFYILNESEEVPDGLQHIPRVVTEKGPAFIALKKMENGDCIFLRDNQCMIHVIRPAVCVSFPFVFKKEDDDFSWGLNARKEICPGLDQGSEVQSSDLLSTAEKVLDDLAEFQRFVDDWNEQNPEAKAQDFIAAVLSNPDFGMSKDF
jgi:Fe-S-cluster containining protein